MNMIVKHSRYLRFILLLIPLFVVFAGMKVPDFSRPHKPKPMRRAVLDKTPVQTVMQSVVKIDVDPFVSSRAQVVVPATEEFFPEVFPVHVPAPLLLLSAFPPRAPPITPVSA